MLKTSAALLKRRWRLLKFTFANQARRSKKDGNTQSFNSKYNRINKIGQSAYAFLSVEYGSSEFERDLTCRNANTGDARGRGVRNDYLQI